MRILINHVWAMALLAAAVPGAACAQDYVSPSYFSQDAYALYSQEQLEQLLAPIALYPDPLIDNILRASTMPLDVIKAYRWMQERPGRSTQQLIDEASVQNWDPSVKALVATPQVLQIMNENIDWTEQLGDAYVAQQIDVNNAVQHLRQMAFTSGSLASVPQQTVVVPGPTIYIRPVNPRIVYVPVYRPERVYGAWPYAHYRPYYFPRTRVIKVDRVEDHRTHGDHHERKVWKIENGHIVKPSRRSEPSHEAERTRQETAPVTPQRTIPALPQVAPAHVKAPQHKQEAVRYNAPLPSTPSADSHRGRERDRDRTESRRSQESRESKPTTVQQKPADDDGGKEHRRNRHDHHHRRQDDDQKPR